MVHVKNFRNILAGGIDNPIRLCHFPYWEKVNRVAGWQAMA